MSASATRVPLRLQVNGRRYDIAVEPRRSLADALREDCGLTGTHLGCEHGVCGVCTVQIDGEAARSCLVFAVQVEGASIRTIEGLAPDEDSLHPLQQAFLEHHGLQCGFCTPGILVLVAGYLEEHPDADEDELRDLLSSVLCRCTGYQNILKAVLVARDVLRGRSAG